MKRTEIILMVMQVPVDYVMLLAAAVSAYYMRFSDWAAYLRPVMFELSLFEFIKISSAVALAWIIVFALTGLYTPDPNRKFSSAMTRVILGCSTGLAAVALYIMFTQQLFDSRFLVAAGWGFAVIYVSAGRLFMRGVKGLLYRMSIGLRRIMIIGSGELTDRLAEVLKARPELGYRVVGVYDHFDATAQEEIALQRIDELILTNPRAREAEALHVLDVCNDHHITFKYSADLFSTYTANMSVHPLGGIPIVELKRARLDGWGRVLKRLFDIVFGCAVIVVLSPVMAVVALAIALETGRPILYKNERVGARRERFFTLKFRSMYQKDCTGPQFGVSGKKAEERERELIKKQNSKIGPIYKIGNDPRVTKVGSFIRRWSLDELPQFFNVLGGAMSTVGPRPHQPREVEGYDKEHRSVFSIKPGITGLAQISGRSDLSFEEEMKLDILYMERWSLMLDMIILLKTPFILFKKRKAL